MKDDEQAGRIVETGGGSYIEGDVHLERGDLVAGDKIVYPAPSPPLPIPLQRPRRAEHFVGRERALARLVVALQPGEVITICGAGGIGKSALAAEAIWTLSPGAEPPERFPDGIVTHRFYRQPRAALALEAIARAYGEAPRPTPIDAAQRALAGRKVLLYLDGAENADDLSSILDVCGGCGVLITSRRRRDALSTRRDVQPLPLEDAVALLRAWGGPYAADEEAARRVCQLVGGLPMAVRLAGRYLAEVDEPVGAYLAWLEETPLEALDHGKRRRESVPVLLERSLSQVNERARAALSVAGVLAPAPFGAGAVAAGLDAPDRDVRQALGELVGYGLLVRTGERYVASHALVHTYARERCPPTEAAVMRLAAYYAAWAREQSALSTEGYQQLDGERVHVMQVLERCADRSRTILGELGSATVDRLRQRMADLDRVQP